MTTAQQHALACLKVKALEAQMGQTSIVPTPDPAVKTASGTILAALLADFQALLATTVTDLPTLLALIQAIESL